MPIMKKMGDIFLRICSWPRLTVACAVVLTAMASLWLPSLDIDLSISQRFMGGPAVEAYEELVQKFGPEPALFVVVEPSEGSVWEDIFFARVKQLAGKVEKVQGIQEVSSITGIPGVELSESELKSLPMVKRTFVSRDGAATLVVIKPKPEALSPSGGVKLVNEVKAISDAFSDKSASASVAGPLALQTAAIEYSRRDLAVVTVIALVAIALLLGISFRSVPAVAGPLAVAAMTVVVTLGILSMADVTLSQFALIAIPVLVGLSVLDGVHVVHAYRQRADLRFVIQKELVPCIWTSLTTLIGFVVLVTANISQVRSIGLVIAIGVPISFLLSFTVLPSLMTLAVRGQTKLVDPFVGWSRPLASFVQRRCRTIVIAFVVVTLVASAGMFRLHISLDFPKIFRSDIPSQAAMSEMDKRFRSSAYFQLLLKTDKPGGFLDPEMKDKVSRLHTALGLSANVAGTVSYLNVVEPLRSSWIADDAKTARMLVALSSERLELFGLLQLALKNLAGGFKDSMTIVPTGFAYLYKSMERVILDNFLRTFLYALVGIVITLMIIARSLRRGFAGVLANIMPIGMVLGLMGWFGVGVSVGVVILPAVGLGLLADDTIHFIMALKRGGSIEDAYKSSGCPIVLTQFILLAVFGSLVVSPFISNITLGIFMSVLLVIGLAFDLLFVPAVILAVKKPQKSTS